MFFSVFGLQLPQVAFNTLNAKTAPVVENASKARTSNNLRRGGNRRDPNNCNLV
jgi:hypothetical protein